MASDLGEKTPGKERRHKYQQKTHFEAKRMRPGRAELPVHHSEALWMATKAPRATLCGISTLPRANATSPCQVLGAKTRKFTPLKHTHTHIYKEISTKLEHKKATFTATQSHRSWMVRGRGGSKISALRVKKRSKQLGLWRENLAALCFNLLFRLSFYPLCFAKWIKDTLRSSFCIPLSSRSRGFVANVTHRCISNVLKGYLEKKYPLIGFTHPLPARLWK